MKITCSNQTRWLTGGLTVLAMLVCAQSHAQQIFNEQQSEDQETTPVDPIVVSAEEPLVQDSLGQDSLGPGDLGSLDQSDDLIIDNYSSSDFSPLYGSAINNDSSFAEDSQSGSKSSDWFSGLRVGYEEGFVIANKESVNLGADNLPFRFKINGWGQIRETTFESNSDRFDKSDENQFQLKRARIIFSGSAFTSDFSYLFQLDGRSSDGDDIRLLDYFLSYDFGHHRWGLKRGTIGFNTGKYKMPFSLARYLSGKQFEFTDRSMASTYFDVNRSLAWGLYGRDERWRVPIYWEAAIFNGLVTGGAETGSSGSLDNNFAYSARVAWYPIGKWGYGQLADFEGHRCLATRVGFAAANSTINRSGRTEFNTVRVVDSGDTLASILPDQVFEYTVNLFAMDASFKYRGWSFTSEYYFRTIDEFRGAQIPDLFDFGFWFQTGKFIVPRKFELLARWSRVSGESGTLGQFDQASDEIAAGFAWYFKDQHSKLTFDITKLDGAPINSSALDISPGDSGWLARTQIQFAF